MNRPLLCFFAALATLTAVAAPHEFASPNGQIVVNVNDTEGCPTYTVSLDGTTILLPSPLGLKTNVADLTTNLSLTNCETKTINDSYTLGNIKQSRVEYTATEATCHFARDGRPVLDIVFRVSDRLPLPTFPPPRHPMLHSRRRSKWFSASRRHHHLPLPPIQTHGRLCPHLTQLRDPI